MPMRARKASYELLLLGLLSLSACGPAQTGPATPGPLPETTAEATPEKPEPPTPVRRGENVVITLLYTTDEHGWLEGVTKDGETRGGAAELLGQLVTVEKHCPGPLPPNIDIGGAVLAPSPEDCAKPHTLLLSSGDNFTGPAISTYLQGAPMAVAMARMGYAASAFGNHELDFGREQFVKNRNTSKVPYLAANVKITDAKVAADFGIEPFRMFELRGIKIAVVGLAAADTLKTAMADRFAGISFEPTEESLGKAVGDAWAKGADAVVVTAHECPTELVPIIARHPDWQLAFVGGGHCHKKLVLRAGDVAVISPEWRLFQYARVKLTVNTALPPGARVVSVLPQVIDVKSAAAAPVDRALQNAIAASKAEVDKALGAPIGETVTGLDDEPFIGQMVAQSWLAELGGDVAIMNRGGVRQTIPAGTITLGTVYGILPFDNRIMKMNISGEVLQKHLEMSFAIPAGAKKDAKGKWIVGKAALDPKKIYKVLATDFMYMGGDGATFQAADPKAEATGILWRDPFIRWIQKQKTTKKSPLEGKLPKVPKEEAKGSEKPGHHEGT
jgi:2',3'-cyclic-nucleotide 2'-phosphodiesterase (5'-nucleotidase family)